MGASELQVPVYHHVSSGIRVWCQAIELAPPDAEDLEVVFHYLGQLRFHDITRAASLSGELWGSLQQDLHYGRGVYADFKEPEQVAARATDDALRNQVVVPGENGCNYCLPILVSPRMVYGQGTVGLICCEKQALSHAVVNNERRYRRIVQNSEEALGADHLDTLDKMSYLAFLLDSSGKLGEAEKLYRFVLQGYEKALGPEDPDTLKSLNNLAALLQSQGRLREAEPLSRRALEGTEASLGTEHPDTLTSANNLACLLRAQGLFGDAETLFRRCLQSYEATLGSEHPSALAAMSNLAYVLNAQTKLNESDPICCRALYLCEKVLGAEHPDTLGSLNNLAVLRQKQDHFAAAESLYRSALARCESKLGSRHVHTLLSANHLARFLESRGNHDEAQKLYCRVCTGYENLYGVDHPRTCAVECSHIRSLKALGQLDEVASQKKLRSQPQAPHEVCINDSNADTEGIDEEMNPEEQRYVAGALRGCGGPTPLIPFHNCNSQDDLCAAVDDESSSLQ